MTTSNDTELKQLEADLEKATAQERAGISLCEARAAKDMADDVLTRSRQTLNDAENRLRFHECCVKRAPELIAEARFSPQRMLIPTDGGISAPDRDLLVGMSEAITDLRGFIDTADLRAVRLRKEVASAKKPIGSAEAAAKAAANTVARCKEEYDAAIQNAETQFAREYLKNA